MTLNRRLWVLLSARSVLDIQYVSDGFLAMFLMSRHVLGSQQWICDLGGSRGKMKPWIHDPSGSLDESEGRIYDPSGSLDKTKGRIHDPSGSSDKSSF